MTTMYRYRYLLSNFTGAPGYTSFYSDPEVIDTGFFNTFWTTFPNYFPHGLTITTPTEADVMEVETGNVLGTVPLLEQAPVVSTLAAQPYAGMSGAFIDWTCAPARVHSRVVRGRTFLVPLDPSVFTNAGTLAAVNQGQLQSAARTLIASTTTHLSIWSRPFAGRDAIVRPGKPTLPAIPARVGTLWPITNATVPSMQATLRSRRT